MSDATIEFFEELARRRHDPRLIKANGTLRFELRDGARINRWVVTIRKGDISVSRTNAEADAIVRGDRATFERILAGEANAMATFLRGALAFEGNPELIVLFQRLFPGPPKGSLDRRPAGYAKRRS
jgi:putative sterol carrier protein